MSYCSKCGLDLTQAFHLVELEARESQLERNILALETRTRSSSLNLFQEEILKDALEGLREELEGVKAELTKLLSCQTK